MVTASRFCLLSGNLRSIEYFPVYRNVLSRFIINLWWQKAQLGIVDIYTMETVSGEKHAKDHTDMKTNVAL